MFMKLIYLFLIVFIQMMTFPIHQAYAELHSKERNILAKEAELIDLPEVHITDGSWNKLPGYHDRNFRQDIPDQIRQEFISNAEGFLNDDRPVVKATGNSSFTANPKSASFSTEIAGACPEEAHVKSWIRSYTLNRNKSFVIHDKFELSTFVKTTSLNLMTCSKVTQVKPGLFRLDGDGFSMNMSSDPKVLPPDIESIEVTGRTLKQF